VSSHSGVATFANCYRGLHLLRYVTHDDSEVTESCGHDTIAILWV